jgi:SNF2 family DNA or RNA helicase
VLDEAQRIKNRDSRTAEVARSIRRRRSWALTGTPIENRPEELGALFEFMEVVPKAASPDLRQLSKLAKKYILRRTKDLVMKDMPPRIDRDAELELTDAQELAYRTAEKEGVVQLNDLGDSITVQHVFELVLRLKQITNYDPLTGESAKLERLMADMEEIGASGGKAILFSPVDENHRLARAASEGIQSADLSRGGPDKATRTNPRKIQSRSQCPHSAHELWHWGGRPESAVRWLRVSSTIAGGILQLKIRPSIARTELA